jgi:hypothetical protein
MSSHDQLLVAGEAEIFKGAVHLCLFGLAATCLCYGGMAFSQRREKHLAQNVIIYAVLTWFEFRQIQRHLKGASHGWY